MAALGGRGEQEERLRKTGPRQERATLRATVVPGVEL